MDKVNPLDLIILTIGVFTTFFISALSKIILFILGFIMVFVLLPQTRTASHFLCGFIGACVGGLILQSYTVAHVSFPQYLALCLAVGIGASIIPFFILFKKVFTLFAADEELAQTIYEFLRTFLFGWLKFFTNKVPK